ncbi:hypothetical protein GCM10010329_31030 [Streptomyces spiroverticillatus]|uniref:DUF7927 domain-containing protein n=1 Tax=Streptomyces finlayi TaxID=67296 RepID=A0A919C968_9ACTN|nr:hypothetical protein [Streptomyces finlayi]GHA06266.1 hypothetical protein GCM10010329_31030 [Streptomyces spiroverticillatus]GHC89904.1 hypothetical protein GCM10010334_23440 [Streptomyces finlayi]
MRTTTDLRTAVGQDTVTFTTDARNYGDTDRPDFVLKDDLTGVVDESTLLADTLTATIDGRPAAAPEFDRAARTLTWRGALRAGTQLRLTYKVRVARRGADYSLRNSVQANGTSCPTGTAPECSAEVRLSAIHLAMLGGRTDNPRPGQRLDVTITVENAGGVDFTRGQGISALVDLTDVLDDADYNQDVRNVSGPPGTFVFTPGKSLRWSGPLRSKEKSVFTYSVTVKRTLTGNGQMTAFFGPTTPLYTAEPRALHS